MLVTIQSNAAFYGIRYRSIAAGVGTAVEAAMRAVGDAAKADAVRLSSGTVMTGPGFRPYSRVRGFPAGPQYPAMINERTGRFKNGWRVQTRVNANNILTTLSNTSPEARYLTKMGTARMVGRPILEAVAANARPRMKAQTAAALAGLIATGKPGSRVDLLGSFVRGFAAGAAIGRSF